MTPLQRDLRDFGGTVTNAKLTLTFQTLLVKAIQHRSTMITKCRTEECRFFKFMWHINFKSFLHFLQVKIKNTILLELIILIPDLHHLVIIISVKFCHLDEKTKNYLCFFCRILCSRTVAKDDLMTFFMANHGTYCIKSNKS